MGPHAATIAESILPGPESKMNRKHVLTIVKALAVLLLWWALASAIAIKFFADFTMYHRSVRFIPCMYYGGLYWLSWAAVLPLIRTLSPVFLGQRGRWLRFLLCHITLGGLASCVHHYLMVMVFRLFFLWDWFPQSYYPLSMLLLNYAVYVCLVAIDQAADWFRRCSQLELQQTRLSAALSQSRLQALRMQLHPHFFFNSLNSVRMLIETEPAQAVRMTTLLGNFLRTTLNGNGEDEVLLSEELKFIEGYLEIQQIRFEDRIRITFDVGDDVIQALVPSLILQPVVENAMIHGCGKSLGDGALLISARQSARELVICVQDSGSGEPIGSIHEGIGLSNTRSRLENLYGDQGRLHFSVLPAGGTLVEVILPMRRPDD